MSRAAAVPPAGKAPRLTEIVVDGRTVPVSNLDKALYPQSGFTKGDLINYYIQVAPVLLPHLKGRPLTLKRYPDGVDGFFFYEKRCPPHRPNWIHTASVYSHGRGQNMDYCLADDLPSLVWAANLADLELHTNLYLYRAQERPTVMVFDLDPGEGANIVDCARVGLWLREALHGMNLQPFIKTSGSKGLQLYVPLNTAVTFDETKAAARGLAETLERDHPEMVVTKMAKDLRRKRVLIDWSQNDQHKTTVCVYSLRATKDPSVSTPLEWREVETLLRTGNAAAVRFDPKAVLARIEKLGDLFAPVLQLKQSLPTPAEVSPAPEAPARRSAATPKPAARRPSPARKTQRAAASRTTSRAALSSRKPRKTG